MAGDNSQSTDLRSACEAVVLQTVIPAMKRVVDEALAAKFDEWQQVAVQRLDATLREMARSTGRPVVNINTSARNAADLEKINVDAPESPEDVARLRSTASPLNKFLRERWQTQWVRAGLRHTSCSLQFSILMQARRVRALSVLARGDVCARAREAAKMTQLHAQGQTGRYVGQIGRAQFHYTVADRPLMQLVWEEDLWPVRMPAATMQIRVCALSLVRGAVARFSRKSCGSEVSPWWMHRPWALSLGAQTRGRGTLTRSSCRAIEPRVGSGHVCAADALKNHLCASLSLSRGARCVCSKRPAVADSLSKNFPGYANNGLRTVTVRFAR